MRNVNNTVETVNAAASAIVSAESRVQPSSVVQKKKWGSWRSLYWCFGSQKNNKRIGHAVLVPEPVASGSAPVAPVQNSSSSSTSIFLPFIAPPSSPASFLQSGPSSVSHTPHNLTGSNPYPRNEPASAFAIGPYANETQPVTPPVDSAVYTPPPESGRVSSCATPSSPEVPFAQLLTSSLERARRNGCCGGGVGSHKFSAGHYEFKSHQVYPGSPGGGNLISPGSVVSNSGTSSPYPPGKCSIVEFRVGEPPKFLGFEHFTARKWGSRFGSGSITPAGQGSRLGSGALTPDCGSGGGLGSKLGSGAVTPNGGEVVVVVGSLLDSQISEVASLANSDEQDEGGVVAHRVSFELTGEDVARCFASKVYGVGLDDGLHEKGGEDTNRWSGDELSEKLKTFSLGSSKEFKFDNTKEEMIEEEKTAEWWANEKVAGKGDNSSPGNSWSFFPVLRSGGFS